MKLEHNTVYEHDMHEEVLVTGINKRYQDYDSDSDDGIVAYTYVSYSTFWQIRNGSIEMRNSEVEMLDAFVRQTGDKIRSINL